MFCHDFSWTETTWRRSRMECMISLYILLKNKHHVSSHPWTAIDYGSSTGFAWDISVVCCEKLFHKDMCHVENRETCTMVFKSLNDLAPENLGNIFSKLSDVHTRILRNTKCNLAVPKMRTAYGQKSFAYRGAKAWNKLDSEMKLAP